MKRTKEQRETDMNTLARMYVKGNTQMDIARTLGVSQGQISMDLKRLLKRWEETRLNQIDRYKHEQLLRVNLIEQEMWEAWEKSKTKPKVTINKSKSGEFQPKKDIASGKIVNDPADAGFDKFWRASSVEEEARGDMSYMNGIMWCCQERAKILGLYAPKKVANTNPEGDKEAGISAREELMGLIGGIAKKLAPSIVAADAEREALEARTIDGILELEDFTADKDNSKQVDDIPMPDLVKRLKDERLKRLPPARDAAYYERLANPDAVPEESVKVAETEDAAVLARNLQERLERR